MSEPEEFLPGSCPFDEFPDFELVDSKNMGYVVELAYRFPELSAIIHERNGEESFFLLENRKTCQLALGTKQEGGIFIQVINHNYLSEGQQCSMFLARFLKKDPS